jgi:GT2 family glycosyltransferase
MKNIKISVIVTNWNGLTLLKKNLEAIIKASPEAQEVILTDDASQDDSVNFAKTIQKKFPKLKIISHKTNQGFGANSNNAVLKSQGDLVVLLNNDIYPDKGYISQ